MSDKILKSANLQHIKNGVYYVPNGVIEIADNAFSNVDRGTIKFDNKGKLFVEGGSDPIFGLKKIVLPEGIKKIGAYAFHDCLLSVMEINFPQSLEEIGDFAFWAMDSIKKIYLTPNIKKIGQEAFCNSSNLTIYFKGKESDIPKGWHNDWHSNCKVKYE